MAQTPRHVTDAELAVLQVLWDRGPATRRQIAEVLYPGGGAAQYTTVQKLLERLELKAFVRRSKDAQGTLTFAAAIDRDRLVGLGLQELADRLCEGSLTPLLINLVRAKPLTDRELDDLRAALRELTARRARGKGPTRGK